MRLVFYKYFEIGVFMSKKLLLGVSFLLVMAFAVSAQSAQRIDEILKTENLSKGQACYLFAVISGEMDDNASFDQAFNKYKDLKIFKGDSANEAIRLDEFADLVMRNMEIKKSFWYMLTKSPYYALRHLKRMDIIHTNQPASSEIKSEKALNIVSRLAAKVKTKKQPKEDSNKNDTDEKNKGAK